MIKYHADNCFLLFVISASVKKFFYLFNNFERQPQLVVCIRLAINIAKEKMSDEQQAKTWLKITEADLVCLTASKPERVTALYRRALQSAN